MPKNPIKPKRDPSDIKDFNETLRRLVNVPKAEVDKEEAKWKRMQERATEKRKAKGRKPRKS